MTGQVVNVREARARLSQLMEQVANSGEIVSISRWGVEPRAFLVGAEVYRAREAELEALRTLADRVQESLEEVLKIANGVAQSIEGQRTEMASLREVADALVAQLREVDAIQARSAAQQVARSSSRIEALSKQMRESTEELQRQARDLQRFLAQWRSTPPASGPGRSRLKIL